nr:AraC family transcriptional regulator [uncultured Blautia sp.]
MLTVNFCGHDSHHAAPCNIEHKNGSPDWLLLLVKTTAWFMIDSIYTPVSPGMVILHKPGMPVHYGCDKPGYNDDWLHFSVSDEDYFFDSLHIPYGKPLYPADFAQLSACQFLLCRTFRSSGEYKAPIADQLLRTLLMMLSQELQKADNQNQSAPYYMQLSHLRAKLYNAPAYPWDIKTIAAEQHISLSHFQHLYKQYFGTSCLNDIIQARLELAQMYLRQSDMTIQHISSLCGYESELHFMRQFKKRIGMTPTQFRERMPH